MQIVKNSLLNDLCFIFVSLAIIFVVCHTTSFIHPYQRTPLCADGIEYKKNEKILGDACMRGLVIVCVCEIWWYSRQRVRVRVHAINLEHCVTGYRHLLNLKIIGPTFNLIIKWSLIIWWWTKIKFVTLKSLCGTCLLCWALQPMGGCLWTTRSTLKLLLMRKK